MNENEFGSRIARSLDAGLDDLPSPVVRRLATIREAAVARIGSTEAVGHLSLAGIGGRGHGLRPGGLRRRMLWPAIALIAGLVGTWYWQVLTTPAEGEEIDLLSSELPLDAYIDKGFDQWLHASSQR